MKTLFIGLMAIFGIIMHVQAQNPEWLVYDDTNSGLTDADLRSLAIDNDGVKWIGSINAGVFTFDGSVWNHYNSSNSYVYDNYILCISTDSQNRKWIGTRSGGMSMFDGSEWHLYDTDHCPIPSNKVSDIQFEGPVVWVATQHGLAKFDQTNWTIYNTSNSGIPAEEIRGVAIDNNGNKWVATWGGGISKFDGTNWTSYNTTNSLMPTNSCISIYFDGTNIWVGTSLGGLVKFDGTTMQVYTTQNSGILSNSVFDTKIEGPKLWFASAGGVSTLEGTTWQAFTPDNSGIPSVYTRDIEIDAFGNKWIATDKGLAVYRTGGIVSTQEPLPAGNAATLLSTYPNPATEYFEINLYIPETGIITISLLDLAGKEVLPKQTKPVNTGFNSALVSVSGLRAGIYMCLIDTPSGSLKTKIIIH